MPFSNFHRTAAVRWAIDIPGVRNQDGSAPQFSGGRPSWLATVYTIPLVGAGRTVLGAVGPVDPRGSLGVYAVCVVLAWIIAKLVRSVSGEHCSRVCSTAIGLAGIVTAVAVSGGAPADVWSARIGPLAVMGLMIGLNLTGELLVRLRPAGVSV
ncbi:hypothetical protein ACIBG8_11490 [Nonomuraea sp. NPDC050556]|uniref:hypothetical protein n=1 Tax=Nonomuraea sp. NPDC050556 TaxID=3364369 RepID=UPI00378930C7